MFSKRSMFALLAVAICLGQVGSILAADVLEAIPSDALAVVLVNRLEATSDKIEKLAAKLQAPSVSLLMLARVQTGIHEGIDDKATAAMAVMPSENFPLEPPVPIVLLPVTDYAKFVAQLQPDDPTEKIAQVYVAGKPMLVCERGGFAVIAGSQNESTLKDVLASVKSIAGDLAPLRTWLSDVDAAAVATPAAIKNFSSLARDQLTSQIENMEAQPPAGTDGAAVVAMLKVYQRLFSATADEVSLAALGIRADDAGTVRVTARMRLTPGGQWAATAATIDAPAKSLLAGLPGGAFVLAGGIQYSEPLRKMTQWFIDGDAAKANPVLAKLTPEKLARFSELNRGLMETIDSTQFWIGASKADEPLLAHAVIVAKVTDSKKYLADFEELNKLQVFSGDGARKFQIDGHDALDVSTDIAAVSGLQDSPAAGALKPILAKLFGPDTVTHNFMAAVDKQTVVATYISEDQLRQAIAALKGAGKPASPAGPSNDTVPLLPSGSQAVALVAPAGVAQWVQALKNAGSGADDGQPAIDFPESPPIGLALKISSSGMHGEMVVPADALEAVGTFVAALRASR
jgi:hypothetical protein